MRAEKKTKNPGGVRKRIYHEPGTSKRTATSGGKGGPVGEKGGASQNPALEEKIFGWHYKISGWAEEAGGPETVSGSKKETFFSGCSGPNRLGPSNGKKNGSRGERL